MCAKTPDPTDPPSRQNPTWQDLLELGRQILQYANIRIPRTIFLRKLTQLILNATGCDNVDLTRMRGGKLRFHYRAVLRASGDLQGHSESFDEGTANPGRACFGDDPFLSPLRAQVLAGQFRTKSPQFTRSGSFWTNDLPALRREAPPPSFEAAATTEVEPPPGHSGTGGRIERNGLSVAMIRFEIEEKNHGLLELRTRQPGFFTLQQIEYYECIAQFIGIAIADRRAREALRQRVNELTCLHEIAHIERRTGEALPALLQDVVALLPSAFPFPGRTQARITLDDLTLETPGFTTGVPLLAAEITTQGQQRGAVQIACSDQAEDFAVGEAFVQEQHVLETLAGRISLLVSRHQADLDRSQLEQQLRHADRLATIGQLAAGVAHELNEPLANILGFAELIAKQSDLPAQAGSDLEKIISASMHGREIVKKLLIFARQVHAQKRPIDLNRIIEESLYLLESRCAKEGIEVVRQLAPELPLIFADPAQIQQVLVNLAVNAIQAMPDGGSLHIRTRIRGDRIGLIVSDTGSGMSEDVRKQIFLPFFTTKDVGQGTGLGLSVVHGIVTAHGGSLEVASEPRRGSRFIVTLPIADPQDVRQGERDDF
jgi:two-component system NtrC family sensor kinase